MDNHSFVILCGVVATARLRHPQDGLFTGEIDAVDTVNNTYRIEFDNPRLGIQTVPDIEVMVSAGCLLYCVCKMYSVT